MIKITKKLIPLFFLLSVILLLPSQTLAASLRISPASGTINKGCTVALNILLDTQGSETDGTDVILIFDSSKLTATTNSIVNGSIYQDYPGNSVTGNKISISGLAPATQPYSGSGTFATVNFTVNSAAEGVATVKFDYDPQDKTKTTDTNVVQGGAEPVDVLTSVTDGTYTIGTGNCTGGVGQAVNTSVPISSQTAVPTKTPIQEELPQGAITGPTLVLTVVGTALTVLGIIGLALF